MDRIFNAVDLRRALGGAEGTVLVPTMGNLHEGHIDLVRQARQAGGPVVTSIFVNPLQFGQGEDFECYPRTLEADCDKLAAAGCDLVFCPSVTEMYPETQTFTVHPPLADQLCGAHRPGHFEGVCTVVLKLFNLVQPAQAIFGKKDYQQLYLLKAMTRQFNLPIRILEGETIRAQDGLALSSRNGYLTEAERAEAPRLYQVLQAAAVRLKQHDTLARVEAWATDALQQHGWNVDYVSVRSRNSLLTPENGDGQRVILAAARLGTTRLIDNLEVDVD